MTYTVSSGTLNPSIPYHTIPTNEHPVFTGRMPFLSPNQQCQSTEWKSEELSTQKMSYPFSHSEPFVCLQTHRQSRSHQLLGGASNEFTNAVVTTRDSTLIRRPFDCFSKVIKVTVTKSVSGRHSDLFCLFNPQCRSSEQVGRDVECS